MSDAPSDAPAASSTPAAPAAPAAPEQLREDMIQNAVSFLSHPKVSPSPEHSKRDFLQKKGLTAAEIDEAFRRVPQPAASEALAAPAAAPTATTTTVTTTAPAPAPAPYAAPPQQQQAYGAPPPSPYGQQPGYGHPPPYGSPYGAPPPPPPPPQRTWSSVLIGVGVIAAGAYAVKAFVWPYVSDVVAGAKHAAELRRRGDAEGEWDEEDAGLAPAKGVVNGGRGRGAVGRGGGRGSIDGAGELAAAIREQTEELRASVSSLRAVAERVETSVKEAKTQGAAQGGITAADLRAELKSFAAAIKDARKASVSRPEADAEQHEDLARELREIKQLLRAGKAAVKTLEKEEAAAMAGTAGGDKATGEAGVGGAAVEAAEGGRAAWELGRGPSGRTGTRSPLVGGLDAFGSGRDLLADLRRRDDLERSGQADAAAEEKETGEGAKAGEASGEGVSPRRAVSSSVSGAPEPAPASSSASGEKRPGQHPQSYMELLAMLERGDPIPGVRTDIDDSAPDPTASPPASKLAPRPKPWERKAAGTGAGALGAITQAGNGNGNGTGIETGTGTGTGESQPSKPRNGEAKEETEGESESDQSKGDSNGAPAHGLSPYAPAFSPNAGAAGVAAAVAASGGLADFLSGRERAPGGPLTAAGTVAPAATSAAVTSASAEPSFGVVRGLSIGGVAVEDPEASMQKASGESAAAKEREEATTGAGAPAPPSQTASAARKETSPDASSALAPAAMPSAAPGRRTGSPAGAPVAGPTSAPSATPPSHEAEAGRPEPAKAETAPAPAPAPAEEAPSTSPDAPSASNRETAAGLSLLSRRAGSPQSQAPPTRAHASPVALAAAKAPTSIWQAASAPASDPIASGVLADRSRHHLGGHGHGHGNPHGPTGASSAPLPVPTPHITQAPHASPPGRAAASPSSPLTRQSPTPPLGNAWTTGFGAWKPPPIPTSSLSSMSPSK